MTNNQTKDPGEGQGPPRKPRGMGGVILILALVMALFLILSSSNNGGQSSIHAFRSHLLNGRLSNFTLDAQGTVSAQVNVDGQPARPIEVVVRPFLATEPGEAALYERLAAMRLDGVKYRDRETGTRQFLDDLQAKDAQGEPAPKIRVEDAFFVKEVEARAVNTPATQDGIRQPGTYLTAIVQDGSEMRYVRLDPPSASSGSPSLQQVTSALVEAGVPVRSYLLSLGSSDFRVTEPNPALMGILGMIGPWLLVLAIVWFFILRQMRSPGGSGGVLSFGRSRAALYTKENRTNVTFDDVAGMEEAKPRSVRSSSS